MKKYAYISLLVLFLGICSFAVIRYKNGIKKDLIAFYPLQDRKGTTALSPDWAQTKEKATNLIRVVRDNPEDNKSALELAALYIKESRITGNAMYYDAAALKYINQVLQKEPENFEALTYKSLIYLSQHHFAEGLELAQQAQKVGPYNAFVYGLAVDGNVELGDYKAAIENADKMVSLRPDIRSYSRIAYLREIHGDYPGAIEAMKSSVKAGAPGDESTSWARVQLARMYENNGDLKSAEMQYLITLEQRPGYAYAIAGLGNIAIAENDYNKAISYYEQADSSINDYSLKEQLATLYNLSGNPQKGQQLMDAVIKGMNEEAQKGEEDEDIGHYNDRELAYAYVATANYKKALEHALAEYNRRPKNIDVNETVAWVYYKKGEADKAAPFLTNALKTGSKNPTLLCRAGAIYAKLGDKAKAKALLQDALKAGPAIDPVLKKESTALLSSL